MKYDKYIGLPYKDNGRDIEGVDCWGLVCLYYRNELGIELPSYTEEYSGPNDVNVIRAIGAYKDTWELTTTPEEGDVVLFNILGEPRHIGVYIGNNKFMHSREGKDSVVDSIASSRWASRLEGTYKYTEHTNIQVVGAPHPLKTQIVREWTVAGTTVLDFVNYTKEKYDVSPAFGSQLIVAVDGKPVLEKDWATTVLEKGQVLAYKSVPRGNGTMRMIAMFAVLIIAPELVGSYMGVETAAAGAELTAAQITANAAITGSWTYKLATLAVTMAGMSLVDAIFPVRQDPTNNPGSPGQMNLFTGGTNQGNKFGAIPVVLGRMRATGLLGAAPYIETAPDTNLLNLLIIWGFGPLSVENLCAGANPISDYYKDNISNDVPRPETLYGKEQEDVAAFNKLYGSDIEQKSKGVELVNNALIGSNPWVNVEFTQESTSVEIALTCPEGMRAVNTKDGSVSAAQGSVEIQLGKYVNNNWVYADVPPYSLGGGSTWNTQGWSLMIQPSQIYFGYGDESTDLYQYTIIALLPGGSIQKYSGAATEAQNTNPSTTLQSYYKQGAYEELLGTDRTYTYMPTIPNGALKLYTIVTFGRQGIVSSIDHRSEYISQNLIVSGLGYTSAPATTTVYDADNNASLGYTGGVQITVQTGNISPATAETAETIAAPLNTEIIYTSRMLSASNSRFTNVGSQKPWGDFLNETAIWDSQTGTSPSPWEVTLTLNSTYFKYSGWYTVEGSADDEGLIRIDGNTVVTLPYACGVTSVKNWVYLEKGTHTVTIRGLNSTQNVSGDLRGIGFVISYVPGGLNVRATQYTRIDFGIEGFYEKRKDPFNFSYRFYGLPKARYAVRARRINGDTVEITEGDITVHYYHKIIFASAACFDNTNPVVDPPGCRLAKTAIRVQSTNKINGQIDGINAILHTRGKNWNKTAQKWDLEVPINNPASLFLYVLTHTANAYRLTPSEAGVNAQGIGLGTKINWTKLQEWHEFCETGNPSGGRLTYNSIITNTISVMDILRDICAAGMASPQYSDGKWGVVIDKPRSYTTQYFTTHNSWGFSSTKTLPRLPHAFRMTIPDETIAYQANEFYVYNYGYNADGSGGKTKATLFETLQLPGVTNQQQATFMARWHLAQLVRRPETYSLNTDFEYLVCQRGDVVKVTHDVPQWGVGSGRLKTVAAGSSTLTLTEPVLLKANQGYQILVRTNSQDPSALGVTKNINNVTVDGYYDSITLSNPVTLADGLAVDNLFMIGLTNKITQELVVISIEPSENTTAKLTLVDYAPGIYTSDLTLLPIFDANITPTNTAVIQNTIVDSPIITNIISNSPLSEQISSGIYRNIAIISFSNPANLTKNAETVQIQIVESTASFGSASLNNLQSINKEQGSIVIPDLITGQVYKVRARYTNKVGSISGPWSDEYTFTNVGKDTNYFKASGLYLDLEDVYLVVTPTNITKPNDFDHWEFKIYKDSGSADFWDIEPTVTTVVNGVTVQGNYIQTVTGYESGRFNLKDQEKPIISTAGKEYRVACRAVDRNGNYSSTSIISSILVKTIQ